MIYQIQKRTSYNSRRMVELAKQFKAAIIEKHLSGKINYEEFDLLTKWEAKINNTVKVYLVPFENPNPAFLYKLIEDLSKGVDKAYPIDYYNKFCK